MSEATTVNINIAPAQDAAAETAPTTTTTTVETAPAPSTTADAEKESAPQKATKNASTRKTKEKEATAPRKTKDTLKLGAYTDENNIRVPKRKVKVSRIFYVWLVEHNAPINITEQQPVCLTHFDAMSVARIFTARKLLEAGKLTGRRDVYVEERGVTGIKTYGYVVTRRRLPPSQQKPVAFTVNDEADPENSTKTANFKINSKQIRHFLNKQNLKSFHQQVMLKAGLSQEEVDAVETEKETPLVNKQGVVVEESDMDSGEDIPANASKADLVEPDDDNEEKEHAAESDAQ